MAYQGLNTFDECAGECVHLCPQEEECISSSWRQWNVHNWHHSKFPDDAN